MKNSNVWLTGFSIVSVSLVLAWSLPLPALSDNADKALIEKANTLFKPLPTSSALDNSELAPTRVALGKALFFETRVSSDGRLGCATCHNPAYHGADALALSVGIHGKVLPRNAHTVFNTSLLMAQHYGGNRATVEEQAFKALLSPVAYGNTSNEQVETKLIKLGYEPLFKAAYPGDEKAVSVENWSKAIGAYERTLLTPSPFDKFLKGDAQALSKTAKLGLEKFINVGCAGCHNGVTVGGQSYQKFGITQDYWTVTGSTPMDAFNGYDKGRFHDTKNEADAFMFKVPQLRNVAVTAPYFHDGSVATLPQAVRVMAQLQLGKQLSDDDVVQIVSFLESLTGNIPEDFAKVPRLPAAPH
jgi:cytochrome c peroxidase